MSIEHGSILYILKVQLPDIPLWGYANHHQREQQTSWGKHHFGPWLGGLNRETQEAIAEFKAQSDSFNNFLRLPQPTFPHTDEHQRALATRILRLESALRRVTIPQDIRVYRGVRGPYPAELEIGQSVVDRSFTATSLLLGTAEEFSCWEDPEGIATILAIDIPAGHPGAWIEELANAENREYEILLPPRTQLVIDRVHHVSSDYVNLPDGACASPSDPVRRIALCRCQ